MSYSFSIATGFAVLLNAVSAFKQPRSHSRTCMDVDTLAKRAPLWVGEVPYSHHVNESWGYPTDCSGYISWLMDLGKDVKAYAWGSDSYSSALADPINELRFGDIFTHVNVSSTHSCSTTHAHSYINGHLFMFDKWVDSSNKSEFWAYESTETYDVTPGCSERVEPCFNHRIKKQVSDFLGWADESCLSTTHGMVYGGPRRINPDILCPAVRTSKGILSTPGLRVASNLADSRLTLDDPKTKNEAKARMQFTAAGQPMIEASDIQDSTSIRRPGERLRVANAPEMRQESTEAGAEVPVSYSASWRHVLLPLSHVAAAVATISIVLNFLKNYMDHLLGKVPEREKPFFVQHNSDLVLTGSRSRL